MGLLARYGKGGSWATASAAAVVFSTIVTTGPAAAAPVVGEVFWDPDRAHCRFVRAGAGEPDRAKADTWRYLFVTELVRDDIAAAERGYMRLDGLMRELAFVDRREVADGEVRTYQTLGAEALSVELEMRAGESRKSKLGQTVFFEYRGTLTVSGSHAKRLVRFTGNCGIEPERL